jgi:hypothetical protein
MKETELGVALVSAGMLNSVFNMLNPILTGLFYIASIIWLCVQIFNKLKNKK